MDQPILRFQNTFLIFGFEIITQLTRYVSWIVLRLPPSLDGIQKIVQYFWLANTLVAKLSLNKNTSFHGTNTINNASFFYFKNGFGFFISSTKRPLDRCAAFQSVVLMVYYLISMKSRLMKYFRSIGRVVKIGLELIFFNKITVKTRDYSRTWIFLSYP